MPAVTVLQLFLSSSKPVLRFAAVRTLNKVAQTHPMSVTNCNIDMESLISDQNRSIATLAITTLLKTGDSTQRLAAAMLLFKHFCVGHGLLFLNAGGCSICRLPPELSRTFAQLCHVWSHTHMTMIAD